MYNNNININRANVVQLYNWFMQQDKPFYWVYDGPSVKNGKIVWSFPPGSVDADEVKTVDAWQNVVDGFFANHTGNPIVTFGVADKPARGNKPPPNMTTKTFDATQFMVNNGAMFGMNNGNGMNMQGYNPYVGQGMTRGISPEQLKLEIGKAIDDYDRDIDLAVAQGQVEELEKKLKKRKYDKEGFFSTFGQTCATDPETAEKMVEMFQKNITAVIGMIAGSIQGIKANAAVGNNPQALRSSQTAGNQTGISIDQLKAVMREVLKEDKNTQAPAEAHSTADNSTQVENEELEEIQSEEELVDATPEQQKASVDANMAILSKVDELAEGDIDKGIEYLQKIGMILDNPAAINMLKQ